MAVKMQPPARRRHIRIFDSGVETSHKSALDDLFEHLLSQGVNHDIADDLVSAIKLPDQNIEFESKDQIIAAITGILESKINKLKSHARTKTRSKVLAFIGPTGVGKTTTIAKLAARHAIECSQKVVLISIDSERVGALDALKVYGKAIGISVIATTTPSAFKSAIEANRQADLILVDTPGFTSANQNEADNLRSFMDAVPSIEIHLLLCAGAKESDLVNTLKRLKTITIEYLIFTKLDESCTYGNLINLLVDTQLQLSFLTTGRQVPESIETGTFKRMVQYLLDSYNPLPALSNFSKQNPSDWESSTENTHTCLVANKNSDVFHRPDCNWAKKIKPKNMLTFSNVEEAKKQRFMPCRDCQPPEANNLQTGLPAGDRGRISSHL